MTQDDRHLTTEQLSAYLDGQLSSEERARWDSHLQTCDQCIQGLASLRQTVALLHALPQPALPRSFALPPTSTMQYTQNTPQSLDNGIEPLSLVTHRAARRTGPIVKQQRRGVTYLRGTLRTLSAIAAVAGLLLFLSGLISGVSGEAGISTASSTSSGSSDSTVSQSRVTNSPDLPASVPQPTFADITPQVSSGSASDSKNNAPFGNNKSSSQLKAAPTTEAEKVLPATPEPLPTLLFFDSNSPSGRVGLGMLLVLLGVMGFIVFRRREKNRSQRQ